MNRYFLITLFLVCAHSSLLWFEQAQTAKLNRIETEHGEFKGSYVSYDLKKKEIKGKAFFFVEEMQSDLSIKGKLLIVLQEQARQAIAETTGVPNTRLEEKMEIRTLAVLKRNTKCPNPVLSLRNMRIPYLRGEIVIENLSLPLNLKDTAENLSNTFCHWVNSSSAGRGHTYQISKRLNEMLKNN